MNTKCLILVKPLRFYETRGKPGPVRVLARPVYGVFKQLIRQIVYLRMMSYLHRGTKTNVSSGLLLIRENFLVNQTNAHRHTRQISVISLETLAGPISMPLKEWCDVNLSNSRRQQFCTLQTILHALSTSTLKIIESLSIYFIFVRNQKQCVSIANRPEYLSV